MALEFTLKMEVVIPSYYTVNIPGVVFRVPATTPCQFCCDLIVAIFRALWSDVWNYRSVAWNVYGSVLRKVYIDGFTPLLGASTETPIATNNSYMQQAIIPSCNAAGARKNI